MTENTKPASANTKERPILFSGPMVRALLDGSKTQTRRVFKLPRGHKWDELQGGISSGNIECDKWPGSWHVSEFRCPYGQPGDRLWVRETFSGPHCMEKADEEPAMPPGKWPMESAIWCWADGEPAHGDWTRPRPSIHMPRWASRITLEIASVRVERLQDISEADALAEGVGPGTVESFARVAGVTRPAGFSYRDLWGSINGPGSWDANPFVWVIEFKRVEGGSA